MFQKAENLICVTEDKPEQNLIEGLAQNIKQLESSCQTNLRKRKRNDDDDFDYLYGIVGTGTSYSILRGKFHKAVSYHLALNFLKMLWLKSPWNIKRYVMALKRCWA